jgi:plasmid replication initiation protein
MAERQLVLPGPIVKKSNIAARAVWAANSVHEPRLLALVISQIKASDKDFQTYWVSVADLLGDTEGGYDHKRITDVAKALQGRQLLLPVEEEGDMAVTSVFSFCKYHRKKRMIEARFDPSLKPHYLELKEQFTQYNLFEFLLLPSTYSQRIFEIVKSWDDQPEVVLPIESLYQQLDVPESHRADFAAFRRRVLEKAHKDIHKYTALRFEWEPVKQGRAVAGIRFIFSKARSAPVAAAKKKKAVTDEAQKRNAAMMAAVKCFAEKQAQCTPRSGLLQCDLCKKLIQPQQ